MTSRGKVARIHYQNFPAQGNIDSNNALVATNPWSIGAGQEVWFQGDFYIDNSTDNDSDVMRKLLIWGNLGGGATSMIVTLQQGTDVNHQKLFICQNQAIDGMNGFYTNFLVTTQTWYRLKVRLKVNSAPSVADGILTVYIDGVVQFTQTNLLWLVSAPYAGQYPPGVAPADWVFNFWSFGYQAQRQTQLSEYRYWDKACFAANEAALPV